MGGRSDKLCARQNQIHTSTHRLFKLAQKLTVLSAPPQQHSPTLFQNTQDSKELWLCFQQICPQAFTHHQHLVIFTKPMTTAAIPSTVLATADRYVNLTAPSQGSWAQNGLFCQYSLMLTTLKRDINNILILLNPLTAQNFLKWAKLMKAFAVLFSYSFLFESPQNCLCLQSLLVHCATKFMQKTAETEADSHH